MSNFWIAMILISSLIGLLILIIVGLAFYDYMMERLNRELDQCNYFGEDNERM